MLLPRARGLISVLHCAILLLGPFGALVSADCECGYSITTANQADSQQQETHLFTNILETDFTLVANDDLTARQGAEASGSLRGWAPQEYAKDAQTARGSYGESFRTENVVSAATGGAVDGAGRESGLGLVVGGALDDEGMVRNAEIATTELDLLYGTFRAGIKVTDASGTCSAFFWYHNDTQEIDLEFLSSDFNRENNTYPVNLVLQSTQPPEVSRANNNFKTVNLPFDPTADFHEYRFDFLPGTVRFYADGSFLAEMTGEAVPTAAGHVLLSHWSNGNPGWSRGPPDRDAVTRVRYVKAYFNSSSADLGRREEGDEAACRGPDAGAKICAVPEFDAGVWFSDGQGDGSGSDDNGSGAGNGDGSNSNSGVPARLRDVGRLSALLRIPILIIVLVALC